MAELKVSKQSKVEAPKQTRVRTVAPVYHMVHLFTGQNITAEGTEILEVDSWLAAQIEAGKLELF